MLILSTHMSFGPETKYLDMSLAQNLLDYVTHRDSSRFGADSNIAQSLLISPLDHFGNGRCPVYISARPVMEFMF